MREIVWRLKQDDLSGRAANRAAINHEFNGGAPYTDAEARADGIYTNVQPLMAPRLVHDARRQLSNATSSTGNYFTATIDVGSPEVQKLIASKVVGAINRQLKKKLPFSELLRGLDANVVLHGRGPALWDDDQDPIPRLLAIEDLKVPTDTYIDFSNLSHFAVYMPLSAAELWKKVGRKRVTPGWNVEYTKKVIKGLTKNVLEVTQQDTDFPEKIAEDLKQNGGYYASDRVPTAKCWAFFQLVEDKKDDVHWSMSIFEDYNLDSGVSQADVRSNDFEPKSGETFLFEQKVGFVEDISHLLSCQYADGSNVPPFKYHSVRGLGYLLYPVMRLHDRAFCRAMDAYFESMNQLFKNVGEEDRERLQQVVLANFSVLPTGVEYVPANERYTINHNVMNSMFATLRQYISENSASFTQDTETGTQKEMTATEAMSRVQQATALVSSMLSMQALYRQHFFTEIARRYCIPDSRNKDVREIREQMKKQGIPDEAFEFDRWDVTVDKTIGGGNKTLEIAQTRALMESRAAYQPKAQEQILRDYTLALTGDPDKTNAMVPMMDQTPTKTEIFATLAIGTLLQGLPVILEDGINLDEYAGAIMQLMQKKMEQVGQMGSAPSGETVAGLQNTLQHVGQIVMQLSQDPTKQDAMKGAMKMLQQMAQQIQVWGAQIQEQQGQAQLTPEAQSKIISSRILAENAAQINAQRAQQRLEHRDAAHQQKMAESRVELQANLEEKDLMTASELRAQALKNANQPNPASTEPVE